MLFSYSILENNSEMIIFGTEDTLEWILTLF